MSSTGRVVKWVPVFQIKWVRWTGHVGHMEKNGYGEETQRKEKTCKNQTQKRKR